MLLSSILTGKLSPVIASGQHTNIYIYIYIYIYTIILYIYYYMYNNSKFSQAKSAILC